MKRLLLSAIVIPATILLSACSSSLSDAAPLSDEVKVKMSDACYEAADPLVPQDRGSTKWAQEDEGGWIVTPVAHKSDVDATAVVSAWWSPWDPDKDSQPWTVSCTVDYVEDGGKATVTTAEVGGV